MNERTIRRPTGPAIIFLLTAIGSFFTILSSGLLTILLENMKELPPLGIVRLILWGITSLFMSIVLFSKKYNNALIAGTCVLIIPSIFALFFNITPYLISEIIFYVILIAFTYVMVKMPETPIREKAAKFRFVIPVFQFLLILISTIQSIQDVYKNYIEHSAAYPDGAMSVAMIMFPSIFSAIFGFLPVLCYIWLTKWMAEPYKR